jgi:5-methyltetrahydrofolate--homocysteine methyltransferase
MATGRFIIVGENIHCTRIRLTAGKFVVTLPDGRSALAFKHKGVPCTLPIPPAVVAGEEWRNGKVRHMAVAVWQGLYGTGDDRAAGVAYLEAMAREQETAGAHFLDLNVDEFSMDIAEKIRAVVWTAQVLQGASALPLSIDSSNPDILKAGIDACDRARGKPMINSVSLERAASIPVAAAAGVKIIAGATGAAGMPATVADRLANVAELMAVLERHGFARGDIYLDPLVFPISVDGANGLAVLDAIGAMRDAYGPAIHFAPGLSNISFGLPKRPLINQVFTRLCRERGCDGGIVDPLQINDAILDSLDPDSEPFRLAAELLLGRDEYGMNYITAAREGTV